MKRVFIETTLFSRDLPKYMNADEYLAFQLNLLKHPQKGDVISGCGGIRKVRVALREKNKGTRSGARVIYLDVPEVEWTLLIYIYGKNKQDDLSVEEKKYLKQLADEFKKQAKSNSLKRVKNE